MFDKILEMLEKCAPADLDYDFNREDSPQHDREIIVAVYGRDEIFNFYENKKALIRVLYFLDEACKAKDKYIDDDGDNCYDFIFDDFTVAVVIH
jgi:hypothetical protein